MFDGHRIWDVNYIECDNNRVNYISEKLNIYLTSFHPETAFMGVILRSKATKNLIVTGAAEILRGACPEPVEGLRMTWRSFRIDTN